MSSSDEHCRGGGGPREMGSDNGAAAGHLLICHCHDHKCLKIIHREGERKKWVVFFVVVWCHCLIGGKERADHSHSERKKALSHREGRWGGGGGTGDPHVPFSA